MVLMNVRYNYSNATLLGLKDNPGGSAYQTMIDRFCGHTANLAKSIPGGIKCAESAAGGSIATQRIVVKVTTS